MNKPLLLIIAAGLLVVAVFLSDDPSSPLAMLDRASVAAGAGEPAEDHPRQIAGGRSFIHNPVSGFVEFLDAPTPAAVGDHVAEQADSPMAAVGEVGARVDFPIDRRRLHLTFIVDNGADSARLAEMFVTHPYLRALADQSHVRKYHVDGEVYQSHFAEPLAAALGIERPVPAIILQDSIAKQEGAARNESRLIYAGSTAIGSRPRVPPSASLLAATIDQRILRICPRKRPGRLILPFLSVVTSRRLLYGGVILALSAVLIWRWYRDR